MVVVELVGVGWHLAVLLVAVLAAHLLVAVLVLAVAPLRPGRRRRLAVLVLVPEEGRRLVPEAAAIGLEVGCSREVRGDMREDQIQILTVAMVAHADSVVTGGVSSTASYTLVPLGPSKANI